MTDTFTAALDVLTHRGYANALELANEIYTHTLQKKRTMRNLENDFARLFEIVTQHCPQYCINKEKDYDYATKAHHPLFMPITEHAIRSKSRISELVEARQIIHYFLDKDYGCLRVAKYLCRDHSTVLHSKKAVSDRMYYDKKYKAMIMEIQAAYL
jgi:hypothetical protein